MDKVHYEEMVRNLELLFQNNTTPWQSVFLFGHCNATEMLADLFIKKGYHVKAILDNNISKHGMEYKKIPIVPPEILLKEDSKQVLVCITARASASMERQLKQMGYKGIVKKLVDYNSFAEYSFSAETIKKKQERLERGIRLLKKEKEEYPGCYRVYCPFSALGDVYYMMSYLPHFLLKKAIANYVVFTIGNSCKDVAEMFGACNVKALSQTEMDESVQAVLYTSDPEAYIAHHDQPYAVNLVKILYRKKITLESLYKYGVFCLDHSCIPCKPTKWKRYRFLAQIRPGKAVVLSPYAKSVANIPMHCWDSIIEHYKAKDYQIFTNVVGTEAALPGTVRLDVSLAELRSVVEQAGIFIGLRSGLCDVIKETACKKIALYPDCYYSDTRWKTEEIFHLEGWDNVIIP